MSFVPEEDGDREVSHRQSEAEIFFGSPCYLREALDAPSNSELITQNLRVLPQVLPFQTSLTILTDVPPSIEGIPQCRRSRYRYARTVLLET